MSGKHYVVVAGPTGSGKSALALKLAAALHGEIVTCDSVQVYRGFDLGSAKAAAAERELVPHHLLDLVDADADFDAARYADLAHAIMANILSRGALPLVVGGTGLYLRALLGQGWHRDLPQDPTLRAVLAQLDNGELITRLAAADPVRAAELHPNDRVRLLRSLELVTLLGKPLREAGLTAARAADPSALVIVLEPPRSVLHARIEARTAQMLASGLVAEVAALLASGVSAGSKPMQSIGYKQVSAFLAGQLRAEDLAGAITAATRQYAKRQSTWFRALAADLRLVGDEEPEAVAAEVRVQLGR